MIIEITRKLSEAEAKPLNSARFPQRASSRATPSRAPVQTIHEPILVAARCSVVGRDFLPGLIGSWIAILVVAKIVNRRHG
jgi:hypothetical protein